MIVKTACLFGDALLGADLSNPALGGTSTTTSFEDELVSNNTIYGYDYSVSIATASDVTLADIFWINL